MLRMKTSLSTKSQTPIIQSNEEPILAKFEDRAKAIPAPTEGSLGLAEALSMCPVTEFPPRNDPRRSWAHPQGPA